MTDVKHRVKAVIGGKSYDLRPSGNPHAKLPKDVLAYLKEGGHLADTPVVSQSAPAGDSSKLSAEIEKLTGELSTTKESLATTVAELTAVKADLVNAETDLDAAKAEIEKLTPKT